MCGHNLQMCLYRQYPNRIEFGLPPGMRGIAVTGTGSPAEFYYLILVELQQLGVWRDIRIRRSPGQRPFSLAD